jgi:hypothetical protein
VHTTGRVRCIQLRLLTEQSQLVVKSTPDVALRPMLTHGRVRWPFSHSGCLLVRKGRASDGRPMEHRTLSVRCCSRTVASDAAPQSRPMPLACLSAPTMYTPDALPASDGSLSSVRCVVFSPIHFQFSTFVNGFDFQSILGIFVAT